MFNSYESEYKKGLKEIESLNDVIASLKKNAKEVDSDHYREIEKLKEDNKDALARQTANVETKIAEKTNEMRAKVSELESDKKIALEKVAMYEKAFENLGFDVKDMKEILNKLVDGLVAKNQIQLIGQKDK